MKFLHVTLLFALAGSRRSWRSRHRGRLPAATTGRLKFLAASHTHTASNHCRTALHLPQQQQAATACQQQATALVVTVHHLLQQQLAATGLQATEQHLEGL
jgi:hypothetical protein